MKLLATLLLAAISTCAWSQTALAPNDKIAAMLNDAPPPATTTLDAVMLSSKTGDIRLQSQPGAFSTTYAFVTVLFFVDFQEKAATTRVTDPRPALHLKIGANPRGRVYLTKVESNRKTNNRSVKIGHSGFGSIGGMTAPDSKWVIPTTITQGGPGIWIVTPDVDLKPGEYGIFSPTIAGAMQVPATGDLYDFGVDR